MRPGVVDFQFAPTLIFRQRKNSHPRMQPSRNIAVYFRGNFAAPPLRLRHSRKRNKVVV
jgi:hypothetical protein